MPKKALVILLIASICFACTPKKTGTAPAAAPTETPETPQNPTQAAIQPQPAPVAKPKPVRKAAKAPEQIAAEAAAAEQNRQEAEAQKAALEEQNAAAEAEAGTAEAENAAALEAEAKAAEAEKAAAVEAEAQKAAALEAAKTAAAEAKAAEAEKTQAEAEKAKAAEAEKVATLAAKVKQAEVEKAAEITKAAEIAKAAEVTRVAIEKAATTIPESPTFSVVPGAFAAPFSLALSCPTPGVKIRYTIDGTVPTDKNGLDYSGPFTVPRTSVVISVSYTKYNYVSEPSRSTYAVGEVYASESGSGHGSPESPASLADAVGMAQSLHLPVVKASVGTYTASLRITEPIRISGGWSHDYSTRSGRNTVINSSDGEKGDAQNPVSAIVLDGTRVAETVIEGLTITGGRGTYTAGILCANAASPRISDCSVSGGEGEYSYGIRVVSGSKPRIERCDVSGGTGSTNVGLSTDSSAPVIVSSSILAGAGTGITYGISATKSAVETYGSVVRGGAGASSYGVALYSGANARLWGDSIDGGSGLDSYAIFIAGSAPEIGDCILTASGEKAYGIFENYGHANPKLVKNVLAIDCKTAAYRDDDTRISFNEVDKNGNFTSTQKKKSLTTPRAAACGILSRDEAGLDDSLAPTASTSTRITTGGAEPPDVALLDRQGRKRKAPWSIGAFDAILPTESSDSE
jgi:hypothetical protein